LPILVEYNVEEVEEEVLDQIEISANAIAAFHPTVSPKRLNCVEIWGKRNFFLKFCETVFSRIEAEHNCSH
jgi:hypothetical protein